MKKILFGFAFLAGLASCSKDEPTNGGENTENGKYKLYLHYKADYSSSEDIMPLGLQFTVNAPNKDEKLSTKSPILLDSYLKEFISNN